MAKGAGGRRQGGVRGTALERYALLESVGELHDGGAGRPQEVVVRFGEQSLTLMSFDDMPVAHWALASLRRIAQAAADAPRDVMVLTPDPDRLEDADERLVIRDPQMIEAIEAVCQDLDRRPSPARGALRMGLWGAGALAVAAAALFWLAPLAAERLAPMIPAEQERALGAAARDQAVAAMFPKGARPCASPEGTAALRALVDRLGSAANLHVPIDARVYRSDRVNAFAAPGGHVILLSALLEQASGPDEVAAVLAHELGHVALRHQLRAMLRGAGSTALIGLMFGDVTGGSAAARLAGAMVDASYSQEAEREADAYAQELLARAGLPASALADFFERIESRPGGRPEGLARHLASHPDMAERIAGARAADVVAGAPYRPALEDAQWIALREICEG
ncbi:MAG: M48 family metallopeptidase [Pseudomonadota bacterium]|nr:M48 family metallopeptidase [Pseudomonadota bacterium]